MLVNFFWVPLDASNSIRWKSEINFTLALHPPAPQGIQRELVNRAPVKVSRFSLMRKKWNTKQLKIAEWIAKIHCTRLENPSVAKSQFFSAN
jgi:hypothetical protein